MASSNAFRDDTISDAGHGGAPPYTFYGTFQGDSNHARPVIPAQLPPHHAPTINSHGPQHLLQSPYPPQPPSYSFPQPYYQAVPVYAEGMPVYSCHRRYRVYHGHDPLPFCGLGVGWLMFILGFLCASIPWFVGSLMFFCFSYDYRERAGLAACTIAALIVLILGGAKGFDLW